MPHGIKTRPKWEIRKLNPSKRAHRLVKGSVPLKKLLIDIIDIIAYILLTPMFHVFVA